MWLLTCSVNRKIRLTHSNISERESFSTWTILCSSSNIRAGGDFNLKVWLLFICQRLFMKTMHDSIIFIYFCIRLCFYFMNILDNQSGRAHPEYFLIKNLQYWQEKCHRRLKIQHVVQQSQFSSSHSQIDPLFSVSSVVWCS